MKKISLLKQALKFHNTNPTHSSIINFYNVINQYEEEHSLFIIDTRAGERAKIINYEAFFEFLSDSIETKIESFEQIEKILNSKTREEQSQASGNTKTRYIEVFDNVVIFQQNNNNPQIYKTFPIIKDEEIILAVENGETFLNIYNKMTEFGFSNFVYLGGFSNTVTREFLDDKNVVFYLDYDIEAMRIYKSFNCKTKKLFMHPQIEEYFKNTKSNELYFKQRKNMPTRENLEYELIPLWDLINKYSTVVEQEEII